MEVEKELVGGEVLAAVAALDALGPGAVVARRGEVSHAAPAARVAHAEDEVRREVGRVRVLDE